MKKKLIIVGVVILVIMIITVVVIEVKRIRFENVATIASEIVKENYDIDTKLEKYKRVKSKTDKISYELYFSKVDDIELYGTLNCDDINNISKEDGISLNIVDLDLAKDVQEKYGENYEIVKLSFYIANEIYPKPYYRFLLKNNGEGYSYLEGKIPVNRNLDEIFEENENSTWR